MKVPLKERSTASSAQRNVYELSWDNDMALTGRGMRGELAVDVAVQDFGCMTLPILAKVYSSNDSSASHGARCAAGRAVSALTGGCSRAGGLGWCGGLPAGCKCVQQCTVAA